MIFVLFCRGAGGTNLLVCSRCTAGTYTSGFGIASRLMRLPTKSFFVQGSDIIKIYEFPSFFLSKRDVHEIHNI
jgi:hypothetical protein